MQGLILAGGKSERTGTNKLLLPFKGETVLYHAIRPMMAYCHQVVIATGHYHQDLVQAIEHMPFKDQLLIVYNPLYEAGMFVTLKAGLKAIHTDVFILPGDYPTIQETTYAALLANPADLTLPIYEGKRGHPLLVRKPCLEALKGYDDSKHLKAFRNDYGFSSVAVDDPGILLDLDTLEDYSKLR